MRHGGYRGRGDLGATEHSAHPHERMERRGGRGRMFDQGQMRLVVLHLLSAQPLHGYDVIRAIGELVGGEYSPSPGTIYPTLSLLEDQALATSEAEEGGRKRYRITAAGKRFVAAHRDALDALLERLAMKRQHARARRSPQIERAMENLKTALRLKFEHDTPDTTELERIASAIDRAASEIARG